MTIKRREKAPKRISAWELFCCKECARLAVRREKNIAQLLSLWHTHDTAPTCLTAEKIDRKLPFAGLAGSHEPPSRYHLNISFRHNPPPFGIGTVRKESNTFLSFCTDL